MLSIMYTKTEVPRSNRQDINGVIYHLFSRGIEKRNIYLDDRDRDFFLFRLGNLLEETGTTLYAFSLLPNHFHLLIRRNQMSVSSLMSRLLTSYALHFNRRHERVGHLFQNRFKDAICRDDLYMLTLVRYIHLNPLRSGVVSSLAGLERYPYSGHAYLVGIKEAGWYDRRLALQYFGEDLSVATSSYQDFLKTGFDAAQRKTTVSGSDSDADGGVATGMSGRSRSGDRGRASVPNGALNNVSTDHGSGLKGRVYMEPQLIIEKTCAEFSVDTGELLSGSRRSMVSMARAKTARRLVQQAGLPGVEVARLLNISQGAVSMILKRRIS